MLAATGGRAGGSSCDPAIGARRVASARVYGATAEATPNNHLATSPDRRVFVAGIRSASRGRSSPSVSCGIIFSTGLQIPKGESVVVELAAPDNHLSPCPDSSMIESSGRRIRVRRCRPSVSVGIVSAAVAKINVGALVPSTPNNHLAARPNGSGTEPGGGGIGRGCGGPTVSAWSIFSPGIHHAATGVTSPDNHLTTGPHCFVIETTTRRAGGACCSPRIR
jgi:hypothetical protein